MAPPRGRRGWYDFTRWGKCEACGRRRRRTAHHVVLEQIVERHGGDCWATRNRMLICWPCQEAHHGGGDGRIPFEKVRAETLRFAVALMGRGLAERYFETRYG